MLLRYKTWEKTKDIAFIIVINEGIYPNDGRVLDSIHNLRHKPNNQLLFTRNDVGVTLNRGTKGIHSSFMKWITPTK